MRNFLSFYFDKLFGTVFIFQIDADLVLPTMRSAVEEQLNLIAQGKAQFESVLHHTLEIFLLKFQYFVKNITRMDELFEVSFSPLSAAGRPLSRYHFLVSQIYKYLLRCF